MSRHAAPRPRRAVYPTGVLRRVGALGTSIVAPEQPTPSLPHARATTSARLLGAALFLCFWAAPAVAYASQPSDQPADQPASESAAPAPEPAPAPESPQTQHIPAESSEHRPSHAESSPTQPAQTETSRPVRSQAETSQTQRSQVESSWSQPSADRSPQAEPSRPTHGAADDVELPPATRSPRPTPTTVPELDAALVPPAVPDPPAVTEGATDGTPLAAVASQTPAATDASADATPRAEQPTAQSMVPAAEQHAPVARSRAEQRHRTASVGAPDATLQPLGASPEENAPPRTETPEPEPTPRRGHIERQTRHDDPAAAGVGQEPRTTTRQTTAHQTSERRTTRDTERDHAGASEPAVVSTQRTAADTRGHVVWVEANVTEVLDALLGPEGRPAAVDPWPMRITDEAQQAIAAVRSRDPRPETRSARRETPAGPRSVTPSPAQTPPAPQRSAPVGRGSVTRRLADPAPTARSLNREVGRPLSREVRRLLETPRRAEEARDARRVPSPASSPAASPSPSPSPSQSRRDPARVRPSSPATTPSSRRTPSQDRTSAQGPAPSPGRTRSPGRASSPTGSPAPMRTPAPAQPVQPARPVQPAATAPTTSPAFSPTPSPVVPPPTAPRPAVPRPAVPRPVEPRIEHSGPKPVEASAVAPPVSHGASDAPPAAVVGPDRPAPAAPARALPSPTGTAAVPLRSYPDRAPAASRPTWTSGVHLDELSPEAVQRAAQLARGRGRAFDIVSAQLPAVAWRDVQTPTRALATLRQVPGRKVLSVPLLPDSQGTLTACAKGEYRTYWEHFARAARAGGLSGAILDLRPDGQGRALADPAEHAACYRAVATTIRAALPGVRTQWTAQRGDSRGQGVLAAWPGAAHVDIIGLDSIDTGDDWGHIVNGAFGLTWWSDYAATQRRPLALARWGPFPGSAESAANVARVQNMHDWIVRTAARKRLAYEAFALPGSGPGAAVATYRALFAP